VSSSDRDNSDTEDESSDGTSGEVPDPSSFLDSNTDTPQHHSSNDAIASFLTDVAKLVSADQKETSPSSVSSMEIDKTPTHSSSSISLTHEAQSLVRLLFHSS